MLFHIRLGLVLLHEILYTSYFEPLNTRSRLERGNIQPFLDAATSAKNLDFSVSISPVRVHGMVL